MRRKSIICFRGKSGHRHDACRWLQMTRSGYRRRGPWTCAHDLADLNEREAGAPWGSGRPNAFDRQRPSPPRAGRDRSPPDKLIGANAMRSFLALSLLMIICASASAATVHHTIPRHHMIVLPSQGFSGYAVPGWPTQRLGLRFTTTTHLAITIRPGLVGGSTALPIEN
jgi:hypothetical protein